MKVFGLVVLFCRIVLLSRVKAFLYDLLFSKFPDPNIAYCSTDNDCIRDVNPPCFCINLQHICGCQFYGVGTIEQDFQRFATHPPLQAARIKPTTAIQTTTTQATTTQTTTTASVCTIKSKKSKKPKNSTVAYITDDMIRRLNTQ